MNAPRLTLLSSTPGDGAAGVDVAQQVSLVFDESVSAASVAAGVSVTAAGAPLAVSVTASGATVTIAPPAGALGARWPFDARVVVSVASALRSTTGHAATPTAISFSTTPLSTIALPQGARSGARAVVLEDGRVLTAGGVQGGASLAAADLFDPEAATFTAAAAMATPRWGMSAVRLRDGRVLVAGGFDFAASAALTSLEIYDPATATWTASAARLPETRVFHSAFLLRSGRVALVGGDDTFLHQGAVPRTSIALYDPRADTVTAVAAAADAGTWTQLADGRLLCVPDAGAALPSTWDLDAAAPAPVAALNGSGASGGKRSLARLADGRVLVAGGLATAGGPPAAVAATALYGPATNLFTPGPSLHEGRYAAEPVLLQDGRVALVGGGKLLPSFMPVSVTTVEVYDPATGALSQVSAPALDFPSAIALGDGSLLVTSSRSSHTDAASGASTAFVLPEGALGAPAGPHVAGVEATGALDAAAPSGALRVQFSEALDPATLTGAGFVLAGPSGPVAVDVIAAPDARSCAVVPSRTLDGDAAYALSATASLRTVAGAPLASGGAARVALRTAIANPLPTGALFAIEKSAHAVLRLLDRNGDGDFLDAGESTVFWMGPAGATTLQHGAVSREGVVFVGESNEDKIWRLEDRNGDGDANDAGEATVFVDNTSALGTVLSGLTSVAFGPDGEVFISNAGSGTTPDVVLRARDGNGDGDALDPDELAKWNDTNMAGAPWALSIDAYGVLWQPETGTTKTLWRHEDLNGDGDTQDTVGGVAERRAALGSTGFPTYAAFTPGFGLMLWHSTGSLAVRLERIDPVAGTATAQLFHNPGSLVGSASGAASFAGGVLYVCDTSNKKVWRLADANGNGSYDDAGECAVAFDNTGTTSFASPFFIFGGHAPAPAKLLAAPVAGDVALEGVAARRATIHASVNGVTITAAIVADAEGAFSVPLGLPLAGGDRVAVVVETAGGVSRRLEVVAR